MNFQSRYLPVVPTTFTSCCQLVVLVAPLSLVLLSLVPLFGSSAFTSSFFVSNGESFAFELQFSHFEHSELFHHLFQLTLETQTRLPLQLRSLTAQLRFSACDLQFTMMKILHCFLCFCPVDTCGTSRFSDCGIVL